jgi:hypothetical protein
MIVKENFPTPICDVSMAPLSLKLRSYFILFLKMNCLASLKYFLPTHLYRFLGNACIFYITSTASIEFVDSYFSIAVIASSP